MLSHHALASHLAMNGFVVASLTHQGDNFRDSSGLGKASTAHSRARHVSMLLTAALDSAHGERIDPRQVGIIGYSAGSVTALMLAGASPDLGRLRGYCEDRAGRNGLCEASGVIVDDVDEASSIGDPRIKAALLLAPIGVLFAEQALEAVRLPVGLVAAHADEEVPPRTNAYALRSHLPEVIMVESVPGAGHSIFLAPCSDRLSAAFADLCKDPPYVDRQRVHAMMNDLVIAFFRYSLDREVARHGINAEPRGATAP
jgi:predicted dienelactone hydrolase